MNGYEPWGDDETWQEFADAQLTHDPTPGQQAQHEALSGEHTECVAIESPQPPPECLSPSVLVLD